jgi:hypothetical protein
MHSFFAFHQNTVIQHGFLHCLLWAREEVGNGVPVVKIAIARPAVKDARIVAEITDSGVKRIEGGRLIPVKTLEKRCLPDE